MIKLDSPDARKTTAPLKSSGLPHRATKLSFAQAEPVSSPSENFLLKGDAIMPGEDLN
jgi:hypothetical protein